MPKEEIAEVIGNVNLEISELKTETNDRFEFIESNMMNLVTDHKHFKEWKEKSNDNDERRLIENEIHKLKRTIFELETSLKEKEQTINSIIESFTYKQQLQPVNRNRWYT